MIAPCGIEIKVGQVWRRVGQCQDGGLDFTVRDIETRRGCTLVALEIRKGDRMWVDLSRLDSQRGGYKLVKDGE